MDKQICDFNICPKICDIFWHIDKTKCVPSDLDFSKSFDFYILFVNLIVSIIGAITGLGGGAIMIPFIFLFSNLPKEVIIPIVSISILGGSFTQYIFSAKIGRYEEPLRPLINYNLLLIQLPTYSFFSYFGTLLNKYTSGLILLLVISVFSGASAIKSIFIVIKTCKNKNKIESHFSQPPTINFFQKKIIIPLITILLWYVITILFSQFRKKYSFDQYEFMIYMITHFAALILILVSINIYINKNELVDSDCKWTYLKMIRMEIISGFVGIYSSFVGSGGGIIMVPYMIHEKIPQPIIASSNSIIYVYGSIATIIQYYFLSPIFLYKYGFGLIISSALGGYMGLTILQKCIIPSKKYYIQATILMMAIFSSIALLILSIVFMIHPI